MFVLVTALGRVLFGVPVPWPRLAALLAALVVGSASFCALGVALASFIPSREAAPAITNLVVFPLYFLSGVFIPESEIPSGVLRDRRPVPDPPPLRCPPRRLRSLDRRRGVRAGATSRSSRRGASPGWRSRCDGFGGSPVCRLDG